MHGGSTVTHRLDLIPEEVRIPMRPLVSAGGGQIPVLPAFRVEIPHPHAFTLFRGREPIVACGIGRGASEIWDRLVTLQENIGIAVDKSPPAGLWLAVAILPSMIMLSREDIGWLGDFERCMAAVMLEAAPL